MFAEDADHICTTLIASLGDAPHDDRRALAEANALLKRLEREGAATTKLLAKVLVVRQALEIWFGRREWLAAHEIEELRSAIVTDVEQLSNACRSALGTT